MRQELGGHGRKVHRDVDPASRLLAVLLASRREPPPQAFLNDCLNKVFSVEVVQLGRGDLAALAFSNFV